MTAVVHSISSMSRPYAGTTVAVRRIAEEQMNAGRHVEIVTIDDPLFGESLVQTHAQITQFKIQLQKVPLLKRLHVSNGHSHYLKKALRPNGSVLHTHGMWLHSDMSALWQGLRRRKPIVVSPHGMLGGKAMNYSPLYKMLIWRLLYSWLNQRANVWHVTSDKEYHDLRDMGVRNPIAIVPIGVDDPYGEGVNFTAVRRSMKRLLYLGRIHPKKGLLRLLNVWREIHSDYSNWSIDVVGPTDNDYAKDCMNYSLRYGLPRVEFLGDRSGDDKHNILARADLYVLPTEDENFGITVAEALMAETPVATTKFTPWSAMLGVGCGWIVELDHEGLKRDLCRCLETTDSTLSDMGAKGRKWVKSNYSWASTAEKLNELYDWIIGGVPMPAFIKTNSEIHL